MTELIVGFDFGTSSVKVAIQSPYKLGGRVTFTNFGDIAHRSCPWLLPVFLYADSRGRLSLRRPVGAMGEAQHLKVTLLEKSADLDDAQRQKNRATAAAAAYVGLVLREVRANFLASHRDTYGASELRWSLNFGIPSAGFDDDKVRARFQQIAQAGWLLSLRNTNPMWDDALEAVDYCALFSFAEVAIVPEVAAEVVTYAKSRSRRDDLHLVVDMGASTLDLCAFQLHQDRGDDAYSFLTTRVEHLGLLELHRRRMKAAERRPPFAELPADIVAGLPSWNQNDFSSGTVERLRNCDSDFIKECATRLMSVLAEVRTQRYPKSPRWTEGVPLFLCGGGASAEVTKQIVALAEREARSVWSGFGGLQRSRLPVPAEVSDRDVVERVFERLAVACGLSFPAINIGRMEPPSEVPDAVDANPDRAGRPASTWRERFVDKDQV